LAIRENVSLSALIRLPPLDGNRIGTVNGPILANDAPRRFTDSGHREWPESVIFSVTATQLVHFRPGNASDRLHCQLHEGDTDVVHQLDA